MALRVLCRAADNNMLAVCVEALGGESKGALDETLVARTCSRLPSDTPSSLPLSSGNATAAIQKHPRKSQAARTPRRILPRQPIPLKILTALSVCFKLDFRIIRSCTLQQILKFFGSTNGLLIQI